MTQKSINSYKKELGAKLFRVLISIPIILFVCIVSSCSKDDVESEYTIEDLYTESQTLQYQTPDSIESFTYKFYWYLEAHPDAQDHPYYTEIDKRIDELSPKCIVVDTDWEGEQHLEY